jgi:hypothetical protein
MTIDMTNNRVPYGLLTDAEKAALHEHEKAGGEFEYWACNGWEQMKPTWFYNITYRPLPLPKTQDVIAWDRLPEWVEWVARDADGEVWGYDEEPEYRVDGWDFESSSLRSDDWPGIVQIGTADWRESKQRRPRG